MVLGAGAPFGLGKNEIELQPGVQGVPDGMHGVRIRAAPGGGLWIDARFGSPLADCIFLIICLFTTGLAKCRPVARSLWASRSDK